MARIVFELEIEAPPDRIVEALDSERGVAWTLRPDEHGGATTVHFAHDGWASEDGPLPGAAMTWGILMTSLKRYAETGTGTPLFAES